MSWLENNVFLIIYTPSSAPPDENPSSSYYILTRDASGQFMFQKMPEVASPFGLIRCPACQFIGRLRKYDPALSDALVVASTSSTDIGLITRATKSLSEESDSPDYANIFTATSMSNDSRRAQLPVSEDYNDTSPIGLAIDLSSKEPVPSPIPDDEEIGSSEVPLPIVMVLNNEGILSCWWFVYSDAIREKKVYHGITEVGGQQPTAPQTPKAPTASPFTFGSSAPAFGTPSMGSTTPTFGTTTGFGFPKVPSATPPAFGSFSSQPTTSAFGSTTPLGGTPKFGAPSSLGQRAPGFGQTSQLGGGMSLLGKSSPLGSGFSSAAGAPSGLGSGFASFAKNEPAKGFGSFANNNAGTGFSSFASSNTGFGSAGAQNQNNMSFASLGSSGESAFSKPVQPLSGVSQTNQSPFAANNKPTNGFSGFSLTSSFKPDQSSAAQESKPQDNGGLSFSSLSDMLDDDQPQEKSSSTFSSNPPSSSQPSIFGSKDPFPSLQKDKPEQPTSVFGSGTSLFGKPSGNLFGPPSVVATSVPTESSQASLSDSTIKVDMPDAAVSSPVSKTLETPLPPESTSKATYAPGDTSGSSSNLSELGKKPQPEAAPLPPDFISTRKSEGKVPLPDSSTSPDSRSSDVELESAPLPPDFTPTKPGPDSTPRQPSVFADTQSKTSELRKSPDTAPLSPESKKTTSSFSKSTTPKAEPAPFPPPFFPPKKEESQKKGESIPLPDESAGEADFEDNEEDYTNEASPVEEQTIDRLRSPKSPKESTESSFDFASMGSPESTSATSKTPAAEAKATRNPKAPPIFQFPTPRPAPTIVPDGRQHLTPRSPSPIRSLRNREIGRTTSAPSAPGQALAQRKISLHNSKLAQPQPEVEADPAHKNFQSMAIAAETQQLSDDDEDEQLRADLARPLSPAPTLDPFLPHQDYTGESLKPGISGQIERLYRDINSMVDTLGINSRSMAAYLLYQTTTSKSDLNGWLAALQSDSARDLLDEDLLLSELGRLSDGITQLETMLDSGKLEVKREQLRACDQLFSKDVVNLRGQCSNLRRVIDAHTDEVAIASAPLSADQSSLQQDLRNLSTTVQTKLANFEKDLSLLRAKIADFSKHGSDTNGARSNRRQMGRPTVEAVTSTISTMTQMAEKKGGDVDMLEAQIRKLGINIATAPPSGSSSPWQTPQKRAGRIPGTPGSHGSTDGVGGSMYHTPESATRKRSLLQSSMLGATSRALFTNESSTSGLGSLAVTSNGSKRWKERAGSRQRVAGHVRDALMNRKAKVREVNDV